MKADGRAGGDDSGSSEEIEDLVYSFLAIMLEHSMRLKDGWKVTLDLIPLVFQLRRPNMSGLVAPSVVILAVDKTPQGASCMVTSVLSQKCLIESVLLQPGRPAIFLLEDVQIEVKHIAFMILAVNWTFFSSPIWMDVNIYYSFVY